MSKIDLLNNPAFAHTEIKRIISGTTRDSAIIADPNRPDIPILYANRQFYELTGYHPVEIIGKNCRFLQGEATSAEDVQAIREALAAHKPITRKILNYTKSGSPFWNMLDIRPIFSPEGKIQLFLAKQKAFQNQHEKQVSSSDINQ